MAVLQVGAATELEMKEKKARVDDALHATRAAAEEGIVPGGGVALLRSLPALDKLEVEGTDEQMGVDIIKRAIEAPIRQIAENAGFEGSLVVQRVKDEKKNEGFNADTGEYVDMFKAGVIDPKKVVRDRAPERLEHLVASPHDRGARQRDARGGAPDAWAAAWAAWAAWVAWVA